MPVMDILEAFKARVEAALEAHDIAPSTFGDAALGDPRFVFDLLNKKRSPHIRTIEKVDAYIATLKRGKRKGRAA